MAGTAAAIAQAAEIRDRELADVDKKEEASYAKLLEKYETYQQGRLRIARKYDQDIAALASNPEAQQLAREAKQKALDDFTEQFASQFPEFEAWADRVVAASVKKLESLVIEAQEELENLQSETPDDGNAIAVARAKLRMAERRYLAKNRTKRNRKLPIRPPGRSFTAY